MKLGGMFGTPKTLARTPTKPKAPKLAAEKSLKEFLPKKKKNRGYIEVEWPKIEPQKMKDYKPCLTEADLVAYLKKCEQTGYGSFDWETSPDQDHRVKAVSDDEGNVEYVPDGYAALDPWKGEICTVSISASPHEAIVVPVSHKQGNVFEPMLERDKARERMMDLLERYLFQNEKITKIAVNLPFETKYAAKYGKYIMMPVADPLVMWVRCMQVAAPSRIKDVTRPTMGWGLKNATKEAFGVEQMNFSALLEKHGVNFFDEMDATKGEGLQYSAEDSDYGLQLYLYWREIAKQIPNYDKWLHEIEMPFGRAIGLMEYWGMNWDQETADETYQLALKKQEDAQRVISQIGKDTFELNVDPGKSGKTKGVKELLFEHMKLPAAKFGKTGPSLDEESIIDMTFMLENKLENLEEEKYLAVPLPENWEQIDLECSDPENPAYPGDLESDVIKAIRIAQREPHPYRDQGLELIKKLQNIQSYSTLISSHIVGRQKFRNSVSGRIHASYTPWTQTSRLNSSKPNGQNVPRSDNDEFGIRGFYKAPKGKIMFFIDFSGFELRLLAWKAEDEVMIDLFINNGDMHKKTAATMTGKPEEEIVKLERTHAKAGNFGMAYGGTEHALQKTYKTDYKIRRTLDQCMDVVNAVKKTYPGVPRFQREIVLEAREKGYVETIYGYIRLLPGINSTDRSKRGGAERQASNTPIQGSAADVMKRCQNDVYERIGMDTLRLKLMEEEGPDPDDFLDPPTLVHGQVDMIAQIHDEIIFEMDDDPDVVEAAYKWIRDTMERAPLPGFPVPIIAEASVGYSWDKKVDVEDWLKQKREEQKQ